LWTRGSEDARFTASQTSALIVSGLVARKVRSLNLRTLSDLSLSEGTNGEGSISFGGGTRGFASIFGGSGGGWPGAEAYIGPRFDLIADARSVFDIIRKAQSSAK